MTTIHVESLSDNARMAVLEVALIMAWADSRIDRSEVGALQGAARSLGLSVSDDALLDIIDRGALPVAELNVAALTGPAAELAYLTAAWMAEVDEAADSLETARLEQIGARLQLDDATRRRLATLAGDVHQRFDRSKPWWDEYRQLIAAASG